MKRFENRIAVATGSWLLELQNESDLSAVRSQMTTLRLAEATGNCYGPRWFSTSLPRYLPHYAR